MSNDLPSSDSAISQLAAQGRTAESHYHMTGDEPPTSTRAVVGIWLCSMAGLLYLDRICWGQAAPSIQKEFDLTNTQMAYLAMAFQVAYGLFEIPTGHWGDRLGARRVITRITIWWSIFTAMTGAAAGFFSLLCIRFLFGAGEAGALPNAARVITRWFPTRERGRVQGIMFTCSLVGGAVSPILAAYLIDWFGWRWAFVTFGSLGFVWAAGFWSWYRDTPGEHPRVNAAELALIQSGGGARTATTHEPVPWSEVLRNRGILTLCSTAILAAFNTYFYFTWFPTYLEKAHGLSNKASGWLTSMPLAGAALGTLVGGFIADSILRSFTEHVAPRRRYCSAAMACAAISLYFAVQSESPRQLVVFAAVSCFCLHTTLPSWWTAAIEQSGKHVGPLIGLMNMAGVSGGLVSQWFAGWFADRQGAKGLSGREQWDPMLNFYIGLLFLSAVCWMFYRKAPWKDEEPTDAPLSLGGQHG